MKIVSTEELINYKILPYNIYSEFGEKLFAAGEVLTPGKLLQLRHMNILYREDDSTKESISKAEPSAPAPKESQKDDVAEVLRALEQVEKPNSGIENSRTPAAKPVVPPAAPTPAAQPSSSSYTAPNVSKSNVVFESYDMNPSNKIHKNKLSVDDIDILSYKGPINKKAKIDPQTQIKIKAFYNKILEMMEDKPPLEMLGMFANVRDKIVQDIIFESNDVLLSSQLKLLGEYNKCHALNTAILSGAVAKRMGLGEGFIFDVVLAGLLHDIGKTKIPQEILVKTNLTNQEQNLIKSHTKIGYKIIRYEMDLPDNIARVALDHHENNDGSGYPVGKSGDGINVETQIVHVCNYFDNITSNRTQFKVKNTKEALRVMLQLGTKQCSAEALYTFIHMFSYNDTVNFEEMVL